MLAVPLQTNDPDMIAAAPVGCRNDPAGASPPHPSQESGNRAWKFIVKLFNALISTLTRTWSRPPTNPIADSSDHKTTS